MSEQRISKPKHEYVTVRMGKQTQIVRKDVAERFASSTAKRLDPRFFSKATIVEVPPDVEAAIGIDNL